MTTGWGSRDPIAGPLCLVQQEAEPALGLHRALELNLACALSLNSQFEDSVNRFKTLEDSGKHLLAVEDFSVCTKDADVTCQIPTL